ncbi:TrbG/VirB9 family P-type conjugative transfer protein [Cysteiniphilum litorale]|uniref:TrbG/VirB9 family P-type conjugative transfer protein n=1 Tax=Cysteiniphilum litorale TaxID=2056700 RepID=UPI003F885186
MLNKNKLKLFKSIIITLALWCITLLEKVIFSAKWLINKAKKSPKIFFGLMLIVIAVIVTFFTFSLLTRHHQITGAQKNPTLTHDAAFSTVDAAPQKIKVSQSVITHDNSSGSTQTQGSKKTSDNAYLKASENLAQKYNEQIEGIEQEDAKQKKAVAKAKDKEKGLYDLYSAYLNSNVKNTQSKFVKIVSYDANSRPLIQFAPMQTGMINLQQGERVTNISLGDTSRWLVTQSYVGSTKQGHVIILIKPTTPNIVTNLVIITNKRIYNFNITAQANVFTPDVRFLYPSDTTQAFVSGNNSNSSNLFAANNNTEMKSLNPNTQTVINATRLHSNYSVAGDTPDWMPARIFDDGTHTMIAFPAMTDRVNLPVLFVYINGQPSMVNYRYHRPYMIVDRLFQHAELVSGKGDNREAVQIYNNNH